MSSVAKFYIKPVEGEHIETTVKIEQEKAAAVCGTVRDKARGRGGRDGAPVQIRSGQKARRQTGDG